jgi:hypothetical protein
MVLCIEACRYQLDILQSKKVVRNDVKLTKWVWKDIYDILQS